MWLPQGLERSSCPRVERAWWGGRGEARVLSGTASRALGLGREPAAVEGPFLEAPAGAGTGREGWRRCGEAGTVVGPG